jgi:DeoR/GlpR family transcriptional regulator of sugar metabolism
MERTPVVKKVERLNRIVKILDAEQSASTAYLCKVLDVSASTVRRDIDFLASLKKNVQKIHGGIAAENDGFDHEYMFELKLNRNAGLKQRIAHAALALLEDNDSIVLDSGTTCLQIASGLHGRKHLRIATVDLQIATELARHENIEALLIGGLIRPGYYTVGEAPALEMLSKFCINKAFVSADAVNAEHGVTNFSMFEVGVKRAIIENSRTSILVADHTKFGNSSFYKVASLDQFSCIITTSELAGRYVDEINQLGIKLILA